MLWKKKKKEIPEESIFCNHCGTKQIRQQSIKERGNGTGSVYKVGKTWAVSVVLGYRQGADGKPVPVRKKKQGLRTKKEAIEYIPQLRQNRTKKVPTMTELWNQYKVSQFLKLSKEFQNQILKRFHIFLTNYFVLLSKTQKSFDL